jgi:pyruvate formate lyase activating enzyme
MMQADFVLALLRSCKERGVTTIVDTSGFALPQEFEKIRGLVDLFLYDLKTMDNDLHFKYTGVSNELILANLVTLSKTGAKIAIRVPLIPGVTDTDENLNSILGFLAPLESIRRISLLPYNKLVEEKCRRFNLTGKLGRLEVQTASELDGLRDRFVSRGYDVSIGG